MTKSTSHSSLLTIEDYLNLSDWVFKAGVEEGHHEDFFWVKLAHFIDFADYICLPQCPYRILITYFDGPGSACYGSAPGWRVVGEYALSDFMTKRPKINYGADTELLVLDKPLTDDEIMSGLALANVETDPDDPKFWDFLDRLQPYCFASYRGTIFFTAKIKLLVDALHSERAIADIEHQERTYLGSSRASLWRNLGPECGPEKCIEPDCDRLRIKLAVRCFMHQMK
jgi:hypothetical protein